MSTFQPETIRVRETIDEKGYVDCGYCDRRFILIGGPADNGKG